MRYYQRIIFGQFLVFVVMILSLWPSCCCSQGTLEDYGEYRKKTAFYDDFSTNHHNWPVSTGQYGSLVVGPEAFVIDHRTTEGSFISLRNFPLGQAADFVIETEVKKISGVNNYGFGIAWGASDANFNDYYQFVITGNGHYLVSRWQNGKNSVFVQWTQSDYLHKENGSVNRLALVKKGNVVRFYINGNYVNQVDAGQFLGNRFGFLVEHKQAVAFDYVQVSSLQKKTGQISDSGLEIDGNYRKRIAWYDDFSTNSKNWLASDNQYARLVVGPEAYFIDHKVTGAYITLQSFPLDQTSDFLIETEDRKISGVEDYGFGIAWGVSDNNIDDRYQFTISGDGSYSVVKFVNGNVTHLIPWTKSQHLNQWNGSVNRLALAKEGTIIRFYINDQYVNQVDAEKFFGNRFGFVVEGIQAVAFDYLQVSKIERIRNGIAENHPGEKLSPGGEHLYNVDLPGSDISHVILDAPPSGMPDNREWQCSEACWQNRDCMAWTYVKPNTIQGAKGNCWLKSAVPAKRSSSCCVSGIISKAKRDQSGVDQPQVATTERTKNKSPRTYPQIIITEPELTGDTGLTSEAQIKIAGRAEDTEGINKVTINGIGATLVKDGSFYASIPLDFGKNKITVTATDNENVSSRVNFSIHRDGTPLPVAEKSQESGGRLALVIGNADYLHGGSLSNPVHDARAMKAALEEVGFTVFKYENCSQKKMKRAMDEFGKALSNYSVGLFFYAGHGVQVQGNNYLIPVDARLDDENDVEYDTVRADRVLAKMESAGSETNIVILDACRDNPFQRSWRRGVRGTGLAFMNAPSGSIIAYATSPGRTASDGIGENGLYTSAILQHITTPGITIEQMFKRVRTTIMDQSDNKQVPWESTSLRGNFYFKKGD